MRSRIECPACRTLNFIFLGPVLSERTCTDCGFPLIEVAGEREWGRRDCPYCGSSTFFLENRLGLPFFPTRTVCYVCEAEFPGDTVGTVKTRGFKKEEAEKARKTQAAWEWERRTKEYVGTAPDE